MRRVKTLFFGLMLMAGIVIGSHSLVKANSDSCCTSSACCVVGAECCEVK